MSEWKGLTLDDIERLWLEAEGVHPSFGQQIAYFAAAISRLLQERNSG